MNCEEIDKMGPGLQGGARRIPALLGVIFIYEVGAVGRRHGAVGRLPRAQCVPVDLDGVLLVLSARHARAEVDGARRRCCVDSILADDGAKEI